MPSDLLVSDPLSIGISFTKVKRLMGLNTLFSNVSWFVSWFVPWFVPLSGTAPRLGAACAIV
ncbi:MAG: hypothetical protein JHD40_10035 [Acidimicrobiia bacterium]|nr:hypothetical protein [Acidimicrobiia bacterium]